MSCFRASARYISRGHRTIRLPLSALLIMMFLFALNSERAFISLGVKLPELPLVLLCSFMRSFSTFGK